MDVLFSSISDDGFPTDLLMGSEALLVLCMMYENLTKFLRLTHEAISTHCTSTTFWAPCQCVHIFSLNFYNSPVRWGSNYQIYFREESEFQRPSFQSHTARTHTSQEGIIIYMVKTDHQISTFLPSRIRQVDIVRLALVTRSLTGISHQYFTRYQYDACLIQKMN